MLANPTLLLYGVIIIVTLISQMAGGYSDLPEATQRGYRPRKPNEPSFPYPGC